MEKSERKNLVMDKLRLNYEVSVRTWGSRSPSSPQRLRVQYSDEGTSFTPEHSVIEAAIPGILVFASISLPYLFDLGHGVLPT